jgi:hypothetical protein
MVTKSQKWSEWVTLTHHPYKCDISENSSRSDKTLELSLVPPGGLCPRGINWIYLFIYLGLSS